MDRQLSFHGDESGVIATNDDASESKRSCVKLNYYKDEYLGNFVKISEKKAPEINRGYYARVKGIEICVEKFLKVSSRPSEISISFDRDLFFCDAKFSFPSRAKINTDRKRARSVKLSTSDVDSTRCIGDSAMRATCCRTSSSSTSRPSPPKSVIR